jgi:2-oxoglutarate ferredoxin oxidoreductase subunit alpha
LIERLNKKYQTARKYVPKPELHENKNAKAGIIAFGSSHPGVMESIHQLKEAKVELSYLRLKALPFTEELRKFVEKHDHVYVVEQNRDAQMRDLILMELPEYSMKLRSVRHFDGLPLDAKTVTDAILEQER